MSRIFHFLQSDMVFGVINPFSWILNAVSIKKTHPTSMPFLVKRRRKRNFNVPPAKTKRLKNTFIYSNCN